MFSLTKQVYPFWSKLFFFYILGTISTNTKKTLKREKNHFLALDTAQSTKYFLLLSTPFPDASAAPWQLFGKPNASMAFQKKDVFSDKRVQLQEDSNVGIDTEPSCRQGYCSGFPDQKINHYRDIKGEAGVFVWPGTVPPLQAQYFPLFFQSPLLSVSWTACGNYTVI